MTNTDLAAQRAIDRLRSEGFDALTETERTLVSVWLFAAGVGNSGFARYFSSHRGDLAFHAPAALRAIGAAAFAGIAAEANALFEDGRPPVDRDHRRRLTEAMPASARATLAALDQRYADCEEDIDELLEGFLSRSAPQ